MSFLSTAERKFAQAVSDSVFLNPFRAAELQDRLTVAKELAIAASGLGRGARVAGRPDLEPILNQAVVVLDQVQSRETTTPISNTDLQLYQDLVLFVIYYSFRDRFQESINQSITPTDENTADHSVHYYAAFKRQWKSYWEATGTNRTSVYTCPHVFACLFQIRRAYYHINEFIWGESEASQALRADIWDSIFSHDFRRFGLLLYDRMESIPTLVVGASGTGKELAARAIGLSRHITFDESKRQFSQPLDGSFHPVNIAALSPTLIESELFGHAKGAFTGAVKPRSGWFESCQRGHSVFLDEIGELPPELQVKLLRVVQNREFYRLGESELRRFSGKLIVATNRDFNCELAEGRFREDLYYRLCSDVITTPTLTQQIANSPSTLRSLVDRIAKQRLGDEEAATLVANDVMDVIDTTLGEHYEWPGNFRELEQCVWNVVIRRNYRPLRRTGVEGESPLIRAIRQKTATADDLVSLYCQSVYAETNSYAATARIVGLDQRTVKRRVDSEKKP